MKDQLPSSSPVEDLSDLSWKRRSYALALHSPLPIEKNSSNKLNKKRLPLMLSNEPPGVYQRKNKKSKHSRQNKHEIKDKGSKDGSVNKGFVSSHDDLEITPSSSNSTESKNLPTSHISSTVSNFENKGPETTKENRYNSTNTSSDKRTIASHFRNECCSISNELCLDSTSSNFAYTNLTVSHELSQSLPDLQKDSIMKPNKLSFDGPMEQDLSVSLSALCVNPAYTSSVLSLSNKINCPKTNIASRLKAGRSDENINDPKIKSGFDVPNKVNYQKNVNKSSNNPLYTNNINLILSKKINGSLNNRKIFNKSCTSIGSETKTISSIPFSSYNTSTISLPDSITNYECESPEILRSKSDIILSKAINDSKLFSSQVADLSNLDFKGEKLKLDELPEIYKSVEKIKNENGDITISKEERDLSKIINQHSGIDLEQGNLPKQIEKNVPIKVYLTRFWILGLFSLIAFFQVKN